MQTPSLRNSPPVPATDHAAPLVAILGGGQLARMLGLCALRLGLRVRCLVARADDPAAELGEVVIGSADDPAALRTLAHGADVVTFEHEWVEPRLLLERMAGTPMWPHPTTLAAITDKREQRRRLTAAASPQPRHVVANTLHEALEFANVVGFPVVLKRGRCGYDGNGVRMVDDRAGLALALREFDDGAGVLVEAHVPFVRELAVCVARARDGTTARYPVSECGSERNACAWVVAPARIDRSVAERACAVATAAVELFGCVGVASVELFELADGSVLVNEVSPRVHNTAHWTIEGAHTSQYENHLRAVLGWPLGDTGLAHGSVAMANVFGGSSGGDPRSRIAGALAQPRCAVHLYGKAARPGRKLGHVTTWGDESGETLARARLAVRTLTGTNGETQP